jgi:hypothetical protein
MADPPSAPGPRDDAGTGREPTRRRRHRMAALWIILKGHAVAAALIAVAVLVLPSGLAIWLFAAHGAGLLVKLVAVVLVLLAARPGAKALKSALSHPRTHRLVPPRGWPKVTRVVKNRGHK